jgi:hypothetical protein
MRRLSDILAYGTDRVNDFLGSTLIQTWRFRDRPIPRAWFGEQASSALTCPPGTLLPSSNGVDCLACFARVCT